MSPIPPFHPFRLSNGTNDSSVKREIMEVVITRPSKLLPPPPPIQSNTLLDDVSRLVTGKKNHHQDTTRSLSDKILGKMPARSSPKTLPPPSKPSIGYQEDNANAGSSASSSILAATGSLVPMSPPHAISSSGGGESSEVEVVEVTTVTDTDTPHLISYLTSRALGIITDASKNNTLTYVFSISSRVKTRKLMIIIVIGH